MPDAEFLRDAAPAAAICAVIAALYLSFGLVTVLVATALFDGALCLVEGRRDRRSRAPASADVGRPKRM